MQMIPRTVSATLMVSMFSKILNHTPMMPWMWFFLTTSMPRRSLTWLQAMVRAAAEVKPAVTGTDIKSIRKPVH